MDRHTPGLRLTDDEMDTIRLMVEHSWRFTLDPRFIRKVLEEDSPNQSTIRGSRAYGWLSSGVPDIVMGEFSRALIGESVPKVLPTYEAWKAWYAKVADAHKTWVADRDGEESA
ncbi:hypothetical protein [Streptomyces sp. BH105]|uniref:hypothetical protein n=1 Tax=Streptomyces sp. BH105 TaxID=3410408 RepID=UPI003CF368A8